MTIGSARLDTYLIDEVLKDQQILPKYNLNVPEFLYPQSGVQGAQLMAAGSLDASQIDLMVTLPAFGNGTDGARPRIVGMRVPENTYSTLVGKGSWPGPDADFKDWMESLSGKTIGVSAVGAGGDQQLRLALPEVGMTYDDVTTVAVGQPNAAIAQLKAEAIDAYIGTQTATRLGAEQIGGAVLFDFNSPKAPGILTGQQLQPLVVREEYLKEEPEAIQAWLLAQEEARQWILAHQTDAVAMVNENFLGGQSTAVAKSCVDHFVNTVSPLIAPSFKVSAEPIELGIKILVDSGILKSGQMSYQDIVPEFARA